jgi:type I restriction enzyme S subunit
MTASLKNGWVVKPLIEVATLQRGYDLPVQDRSLGNVPIFAANGPVGNHNEAKVPGPGVVTGRSGSIGKVHYVDSDYWPLNTALYVKDFHGNDPKFIYYLLSTFGLEKYSEGTGVPTLNRNNVHGVNVSLPPLPEQKRIATILDKADSIRRKRHEAVRLTEELLRSVFLDMFGDPVTNPKGWKTGILGDVIFSAKDGPHVSPEYSDDGIPFLSARHVKPGRIEWNDLKHITIDEAQIHWKKCKPEKGDILYTKGGTTGVAAVFDSDKEIAVWVHIALLKLKHDKVNPYWLENMLNTKYCYDQSQRYTHGITNQDLGLKRMVNIELYIPPMSEQNKFHETVKKIKNLASLNASYCQESENAFNSLLQSAFT